MLYQMIILFKPI